MLRTVTFAIAVLLVAVGAWLLLKGITVPGIQALSVGGVMGLGLTFERWRYIKSTPRDASWQVTGERFIDPATGKDKEVLYDPASGERRYVER